ncbi:hypothetical protein [Variibacter gotjawalensis]|uniref:hypothetical protein n=1 Tax=Variibacter gotjawalensis TaxID=1333996 RepID=UPI00102B252D|nr:hypothetical protein [Variibacter gotjawalensis]NIK46557.1 hypothetical protein [Variibacter gotjawalensis]
MATLGFCVLLGFMVYWHLPNLWTDLRTSDWQPAFGLKLDEAKCTRHFFVASTCSIKYSDPVKPEQRQKSLSYLTFGGWGGEQALLVQSASNPDRVSIAIATKALIGRTLAMLVLTIIPLLLLLAVFAKRMLASGDDDAASFVQPNPEPNPARTAEVTRRPTMPPTGNAPPTFGRRTTPVR